MGVFQVLRLLLPILFFFFVIRPLSAENDASSSVEGRSGAQGGIGDIAASNPSLSPPTPPPPPFPPQKSNFSPFRPSMAVIVGVLTTMFSVTFLLLLYAKHCKRGSGVVYAGNPNSRGGPPSSSAARKNSGIDPSVIESLPVFRFGSLRGQKDGLECAVCLNRFETTEVLRLLPKCKHAFHVECVDTWLDAHSTCPLCRYRVDPEDILLIDDPKLLQERESMVPSQPNDIENRRSANEPDSGGVRRVSGRHSSAGEKGSSGFLQIVLQRPGEADSHDTASSLRRSLDSSSSRRKNESVTVGCFDRPRKDGLLLTEAMVADRTGFERRFEHRIIVSAGSGGFQQRWSDVQPSDLLYLRSEMLISDSHRYSSSLESRPSFSSRSRQQRHQNHLQLPLNLIGRMEGAGEGFDGNRWNGRSVINSRCVSEITGLSRFSSRTSNNNHHQQHAGVVSRWTAWISQSRPAVRSGRTAMLA